MVEKGFNITKQQIIHGEDAGTISKFDAIELVAAIGFTPVVDPLIALIAVQHSHFYFFVTSADDAFYINAHGMDFQDSNWMFMLHGPNGEMLYGDESGHDHSGMVCHHCCPPPDITARRSNGRLTLIIQY